MGKTGNIVDAIPEKTLAEATGSTFILNNVSYSGADIKVVVNMFDVDSGLTQQVNDLQNAIANAESSLKEIDRQISKVKTDLNTVHIGSSEDQKYKTLQTNLITQRASLLSFIQSTSKSLSSLTNQQAKQTTKVLAEIQTLSISIYRDKHAVRACGSVYPKGFTRGPREIAGTLVFTVFDEHVLYQFLAAHPSDFDHSNGITSALLDQLPPVDITVAFANEYGAVSRLAILGVEFVDEGQTMSIEDLITENVVSFVARDIDPMRKVAQRKIDEESRLVSEFIAKRASDLIYEEDYQKVKEAIDPFERFTRRRNPFQ